MKPISSLSLIAAGAAVALVSQPGRSLADYASEVRADAPLAWYRFQEPAKSGKAENQGSAGAAGNGTHTGAHPVQGALAGSRDGAAYYDGAGARTIVPFVADVNPPAAESFTVEAWVMPLRETDDTTGPCPLFNRLSDGDRQGWVLFQRSPATGWNFRMYSGAGDAVGVELTGQSATAGQGKAGTWSHLAVTWDGPASMATLYVNGVAVDSKTGTYTANTAANARPLSIGAYDTGANPFRGAVDEVAVYKKLLTPAQILARYQNGTATAPAVPYDTLVKADGPVEYLRLNEPSVETDTAVNFGTQGPVGDGLHHVSAVRPAAGALNGVVDGAAGYRGSNPTLVPWTAAVNPPATADFSVEAWFLVGGEVDDGPGPCPLFNRLSEGDRQGWVFFQRSPATGWNFRMYKGTGSDVGVDLTAQATTANAGKLGTWNHVVVTWNGGTSTATMYVNGQNRKSVTGTYMANEEQFAKELSIGSYDNGQNPYHGSVDEVAVYGTVLTAAQVTAHYQAGTNAAQSAGYAAVVLADAPVEYLRLSEPPFQPAVNSGTLGQAADGGVVGAVNDALGPRPPAFGGFDAANTTVLFDGVGTSVSLGDPAGLRLSGPVTLEAWIQGGQQSGTAAADIIAHGGADGQRGAFLRITPNNEYEVGSIDTGGGTHSAVSAVPGDDQDGTTWIHLAGTYDGTAWTLYRNGQSVATQQDAVGALALAAPWAIGMRGDNAGEGFVGTIDEPAVYSTALTAARITAHYQAGLAVAADKSISIVRNADGSLSIVYTGVLESSTELNSGFTPVAGAASPYVLPAASLTGRRFYRAR
ncbi:MAG: LamG domain-containing protein [Verrucomicrobiaceae bacterium]|nr:MAG: LamG domain-containing protein [Verrucomicrobiaceae bacterium]